MAGGRWLGITLALMLAAAFRGGAQEVTDVTGVVRSTAGHPLRGANVFLLQTLEGDVTDGAGAFRFTTATNGAATLVVRRVGFLDASLSITLPFATPLTITLETAYVPLATISVEAGAYRVGNAPDVSLTDLDVVSTPGSAADPFRAIQTFAGIQNVDEGAGLFVRGGDVAETKVMLDGATVVSPFRLDTDRTVSFGRFDPFMLDGIYFSSGGFGAEYGDALSGIADLTTVGKPIDNDVDLSASVAGVSGRVNLDGSETLGARVSADWTNTDVLMHLNGRRSEFDRVPESSDLSAHAAWEYRSTGHLKVYGLRQTDRVGVRIEEPAFAGTFQSDGQADLVAASGSDIIGETSLRWGLATSGSQELNRFASFQLDRDDRVWQARASLNTVVASGINASTGGEVEHRTSTLAGSIPDRPFDGGTGAPVTVFASQVDGTRTGIFGELDYQPTNAIRVASGLRGDHSSLTGRVTADPRVSVAVRPFWSLTITGAWGGFHQVPDPLLFEPTFGDSTLPAMSAYQSVLGVSFDNGDRLLRIEAYHKRYRSLAARARDERTRGGGHGSARGVDVFVREDVGILGVTGRLGYSFLDSDRTDPNTGLLAPSPFDITHTVNVVVTRRFDDRFEVGAAYRGATGRPVTPIDGATFDHNRQVWEPQHGAPFSARLPDYSRFDLSANLLHSFGRDQLTVFFVSVMNVLDARNVDGYQYNSDYSMRLPQRSPFTRTFFFGATTLLPF